MTKVDDKVAGLAVFQREVDDKLEFVEEPVRGVVFKVDKAHVHVYVGFDPVQAAQRVVVYTHDDEGTRWAKLSDTKKLKAGKLKTAAQAAVDELEALSADAVSEQGVDAVR